jgi:hypothetical protein
MICKHFEITRRIHSNSERSELFLKQDAFLLVPRDFSDLYIRTIGIQIGKNNWDLGICRKS